MGSFGDIDMIVKKTDIVVITVEIDGRVSQIAGSLDNIESTITRLEESGKSVKVIRRETRTIRV